MELPEDWSELIGLLFAHRVRFLIVGAYALAANDRPRATHDIDFWVEPTRPNARRLCAALAEFGFPALAEERSRLRDRVVPDGDRRDIIGADDAAATC